MEWEEAAAEEAEEGVEAENGPWGGVCEKETEEEEEEVVEEGWDATTPPLPPLMPLCRGRWRRSSSSLNFSW